MVMVKTSQGETMVKRGCLLLNIIACMFTACTSQEIRNTQLNEGKIFFQMDLTNGILSGQVDYTRQDVEGSDFFLNRDFTVTGLLVDGKTVNPANVREQVTLFDGYGVNLYRLPDFTNNVHIEYRGTLSGETGGFPYVRETISEDFTFLRWETFCYPLFASEKNLFSVLMDTASLTLSVKVPKDYLVQFSGSNTTEQETRDAIVYTVLGNMPLGQYAAAIARYQKIEYETGVYYFLAGTDTKKVSEIIDPVMSRANAFMQDHFGEREFRRKLRVVEIPKDFGSFAVPEEHMTYVDGSAFSSVFAMRQLVHEFIHTGWNVKVEAGEVQRSRFFDESFTCYFTWRVMADLAGKDDALLLLEQFTNTIGIDDPGPIKDWGAKEYGQLGYTLGALFLYKLSLLTGEERFDRATKEFLANYRDIPADFEKFCGEYSRLCPDLALEAFFQKWIYSDTYKTEIHLY
jgi:hypothetical protein